MKLLTTSAGDHLQEPGHERVWEETLLTSRYLAQVSVAYFHSLESKELKPEMGASSSVLVTD